MGGFGSAVLELANDQGWDTRHLRRLGIPDAFIEHGERDELLAEMGMSVDGLVTLCQSLAAQTAHVA
jgi:1-deoxy-D-xylulose-5-phosphate synthase